ncbi:MAG: hypothetical protein WCF18_04395 [Chthoniobacteraceae bacterium]
MRFIVASYGAKHVGMLLTHLHSIARSHPEAAAAVYWQDIPAPLIEALRAAFPRNDFRQTAFDFSKDFLLRISSKVHSWCRAAEEHAGERELCLADVDTLILRDVAPFLAKDAADVVFTHKPDRTALNTGVILAHGSSATTAFFHAWRDRTLAIIADPDLYRQANDYTLGYGAADQMALWQMLGYERSVASYTIECGGEKVRLRAEPCALLNETNSLPVTDDKHILHYKSGWQPILLQGRPFTRNRPRLASWPMFTLYLRRFREALDVLNAAAGTHFTARDFGIVVPSYFDVTTGGFDSARYAVWSAREAGKSALRTLGYAARKLTGGTPSLS